METVFIYDSPLGLLELHSDGEALTAAAFASGKKTPRGTPDAVLKNTIVQLEAYFAGKRTDFDIPLNPCGTAFQKQVWNALLKIPYGETCSYGDIAKLIRKPKASRAIGGANNKNPIPILIPCHRVIGANGQLVGYGGGLNKKKWLLDLERNR